MNETLDRAMGSEPKIVDGDLLDQDVEVIVNAWNRNLIPWWLLVPQGVSGAIKRKAGYGPFRELGRHGPIPLGGAVETGAGRLPHRAIIHVAGINLCWRTTDKAIRASVRNALALAEQRGYRSIAFPLLGAGTGGGSPEKCLAAMAEEIAASGYGGEVRIVRFRSAKEYPLYKLAAGRILLAAFIAYGLDVLATPLLGLLGAAGLVSALFHGRRRPAAARLALAKALIYGGAALAAFQYHGSREEEDRRQAEALISHIEQYRGRHGAYPARLDDLLPSPLAAVPRSSRSPYIYRREGESYSLLYANFLVACTYSSQAAAWRCDER